MCYLDCMLTGAEMFEYGKINNNDIIIIQNLMNDFLGKPTTETFDDYIYSTFKCFAQHKKQIVLDLHQLNNWADKKMTDLIMYPLDKVNLHKGEKEKKRDICDFVNLFRSEILRIFKNTKTVIIISTERDGWWSYSLSLSLLLSIIEPTSLNKVIVKAVTYKGNNWIHSLWTSSSEIIKQEYDGKSYDISMKEVEHKGTTKRMNDYWFIINKKN